MTELAIAQPHQLSPAEEIGHSQRVAEACRQIVLRRVKVIQGRRFVQVEGWQAIATAHGCVLSSRNVQPSGDGYTAIGEVRMMPDGRVIAESEGFCSNREKGKGQWQEYAIRAMAQTRAMSRAARSAFAHVVVLIDADIETTPAEEMDGVYEAEVIPEPQPPAPAKLEMSLEERREKMASFWVKAGGTVEVLETHFGKPVAVFDEADLDFASHTFAKARTQKINPDHALKGATA